VAEEAHRQHAYDPAALLWTCWELGIRDPTAIRFTQMVGREIRIIDYHEVSGVDLGALCARDYSARHDRLWGAAAEYRR